MLRSRSPGQWTSPIPTRPDTTTDRPSPQAPPSPLSSDAFDAYNQCYQNGHAEAGAAPTASGGGSLLGASTFANSGPPTFGLLGYFARVGYYENGVPLTFPADADTNLIPRQWSGPEATYTSDQSVGGPWNTLLNDSGTGTDDPLPQNPSVTPSTVTYYDAPGPQVIPILNADPKVKRVHSVQNFTGWVEGVPVAVAAGQRISDILAWHSVMSLVMVSDDPELDFQPLPLTGSEMGWVDTGPPQV